MIARNGVGMMQRALDPFRHRVDEFAIVLGGRSEDGTAIVAGNYTDKVIQSQAETDDLGRLLDFATARQESFDLLGTDWAIVVDTDDQWSGIDQLGETITMAEDKACQLVLVSYDVRGGHFFQPRLYRRDAGHWRGEVHEEFVFDGKPNGLKTGLLAIRETANADKATARHRHNIAIAERVLNEREDLRLLGQLVHDYLMVEEFDKVLEQSQAYIELWDRQDERKYTEELYYVWLGRAMAELVMYKNENAYLSATRALSVRPFGQAWSILAEAAQRMGTRAGSTQGAALQRLAVFAADQALADGKPRNGYAGSRDLTGWIPCQLKAMALAELGQERAAIAALDLGLAMEPENELMQNHLITLCNKIGEVP
jgi:tetratricopeptide (TPR) repeat protein